MAREPAGQGEGALLLGEQWVPYALRRSRRRTIGLSIDDRGLRVGAPLRASVKDVERVIHQHGPWVLEKLDEWRLRQAQMQVVVADGMALPLLGQSVPVRIVPGAMARISWDDSGLTLRLPPQRDPGMLLEKALKERCRPLFAERLAHFTALLGQPMPPLSLSSARTRWGSCSLRSGIRLNWRLIHFPPHVIDYVVAHEVAHLQEMNHSPRFWSVVERLYPDYRHSRSELKRLAQCLPRWSSSSV